MKTMGMKEAFTPTAAANFDNLSDDENMFISLIKQKTILKIDEEWNRSIIYFKCWS